MGKSLTPVGAVAAANAAGTIPAWDGGLTKPPADFKPGGHYPDPYANDRPLFTITADNVDQYREHLTPGQVAMLKKYPTYKIVVYPTRRSASFPKAFYDDTLSAATHAKLAPGGNSVLNTTSGVPFPIPHDGQEAIWNHLLRYRGDTYGTTWTEAPVLRNGDYTPARQTFEYDFSYANLAKPPAAREPNRMMNFFELLLSPPRLAGTLLLIYEPIDQVKEPRRSWLYSPGQRRVQLAPEFAYDFPAEASDGMRTYDDFNMFNGAIDRYDWKLIGKQEVYIPYNSYKITGNSIKHSDIIRPGHLNSEYGRYELHRVWVVEAQLKPGVRHIYAKRVFYLDEDSWAAVLTDKYDAHGQLWRVAEAHSINLYNIPMYYQTVEAHYDLQSGRYDVMGLRNEEPRVYEPLKRSAADFTPFRLRELGTR
ncbi:DUF1329 domain-containing protein [Propionivibrio sp.]|uniref:DUF1329 domain-containing protein n=1 Tax=Propionivibrio sp. TaxID=2212460 RepID=UPI0026266D7E|nr:DUF1329 domain-containing protein [Propionivibrio sp.]